LKSILSCLEISDCKMEEGSLRCDVNVSIRRVGTEKLGVRTEIKNMNSFKSLEKAISYEYTRQVEQIESGEEMHQFTRRWDAETGMTQIMRSKEMANDYRYFPEGDLVTINISDSWIEEIRNTITELPFEKAERFIREYKIPKYDAMVLTLSMEMADFFDETAKISKDPKAASNWLMGDVSRLMNEKVLSVSELKFSPKMLSSIIKLINSGSISNNIGKKVLEEMFETGKNPDVIIEEKGLIQNNNEEDILKIVQKILGDNPKLVEDFKAGKKRALGFVVGLIMKETKGKANPIIVNKLVGQELNK